MIEIKRREECCGCNACADICPKQAITFVRDEEGFAYPKIDQEKCINCGLCDKTCPMTHVEEMRKASNEGEPKICAAINKNYETRFDSTSGGLFSALAEKTFAEGGFVGGAIWGKDFEIFQVVTDKEGDLSKLRSSKYAQSDAQGFYAAVKKAVSTGRKVLVCGTPCQMVALRTYMGLTTNHQSLFTNLTIVDFICRGINSPLVMRHYIEMMERQQGSKLVAIKQKSKELGWHRLTTKFTFEDGSVKYDPKEVSYFMRGYLFSNAFCRPSCYECRFKGFPRLADITLADCWEAVEGLSGEFNNDTGTSLVLCNTAHGSEVLASLGSTVETHEVDSQKVLSGNKALTKPLPQPSVNRREFFRKVSELPFEEAMDFAKPRPYVGRKERLKRWIKSLFGDPLLTRRGKVVIDKAASAQFEISGPITIGSSPYRKSSLESRLLLRDNAELKLHGGEIAYGCDIELFTGARMEIGKGFYANIGAEVICGKSIKIGEEVTLGRHVTIRDTNGGHYVNSPDYRNAAAVEIGDHVWLCEGVKVMPGVKIGSGSVIAAGAVVTKDIPANCLAAGVPAKVVRENVQWKR